MKPVVAAVIALACCGMVRAQTLAARVDALAHAVLSRPVVGISVAVARDGQVVFARGYGMANLEHSVPVTPETVFHIDSVSKYIESAALLQLVEEGKVSLDDDVTKYIPEAPTQGHKVTVRQLLNHTSGIYSFTSLPEADDDERLDMTHEQVLAMIKDKPFDFEPGTAWRYDNSAFYIAGMVIERVTKQEYGAYVREHLFQPLGMTSAGLCDARMIVPHLASGYERDNGTFFNAPLMTWKLPFAAGSICASTTDLVKWEAALDGGRVLRPSSLALMRTPTTLADGTVIDYGLGTRLGSLDGHRALGHTGSGGGYAATLESFPDDHVTIVVLMNTEVGSGTALRLAGAIARSALGLPEKKVADLAVPKRELAAVSGVFESDDGRVETFARDGKLYFRQLPAGADAPLRREGEDLYAVDENTEVRFYEHDGRAEWAVAYTGGLMTGASRRVN